MFRSVHSEKKKQKNPLQNQKSPNLLSKLALFMKKIMEK